VVSEAEEAAARERLIDALKVVPVDEVQDLIKEEVSRKEFIEDLKETLCNKFDYNPTYRSKKETLAVMDELKDFLDEIMMDDED
jgi:hypothetical protein